MKACVIQPPYSMDASLADEYFNIKLDYLKACDESMDIIVLPEYSDAPCCTHTWEETYESHKRYIKPLLEACSETAKRCNAVVFVNALCEVETGFRNTTYAFDRSGEIAGKYYKKHLPPSELFDLHLDQGYTREFSEPYTLTIDGIKYGFLTCYDFYFYEAFAAIARQNVDIIIGCSLQRSDSHSALEIMGRFCAYNCNAHLLRASVSLDRSSDICGASMIVTPKGDVLVNMKSEIGLGVAEIDPKNKYYKPAGFGGALAPHYEYIEFGRNPWQYRPGGSAIVKNDVLMPYPRVCAHRGFNSVAPENSLPAFGAAVAMGAEEIELDVWFTKDGEPVSIHDSTLDRVSNGTGKVWEYTLDELRTLDFGVKMGERFAGMRIPTLEEILEKFACHCIMNIHLKTEGEKPEYLDKVIGLIKKYDCEKYVYLMSGSDALLERLQREYPHISRCCGAGDGKWEIVDRAIRYGCGKVQLFKPFFDRDMIDRAHKAGIVCNVFWSDDPEETEKFLEMGIDTVLTNDYNLISQAVERFKSKEYKNA